MTRYGPDCFCGSRTIYQDSKEYYHGTSYGMRYICERWPECLGSVGAHPDGQPLGTVPDPETKRLRGVCHGMVDAIWRDANLTAKEQRQKRGSVYRWLQNITGLSQGECHIGKFNAEQCRFLIKCIKAVPYEQRHELLPNLYTGRKIA
jgi:hypothetical protein